MSDHTPTPVPSEVAETTAGERECYREVVPRAYIDRILAQFPMDEHGIGHIADCGYDANDERCECYTLPGRLTIVLAALLDRVRREEGERIAQAIEAHAEANLGPESRRHYNAAARIARAASVGRGVGL